MPVVHNTTWRKAADQLARHDVRFDLEGLDDTSDAGACIPYELFIRLRQMYYKLAMREVQLGRHRRAAYIFAFLLNDFGDAARVLEQGLHFREAAALYERIGQLEAAGLCLEKGGCWPEAIAVWQLLQDHLRVAAIHERLDQIDEAAEAYGRAVQQRQEAGDYLGAAELLVTKLNRSWEALEVLQRGWQQATQARAAKASAAGCRMSAAVIPSARPTAAPRQFAPAACLAAGRVPRHAAARTDRRDYCSDSQ